jgi:hypothetical protein
MYHITALRTTFSSLIEQDASADKASYLLERIHHVLRVKIDNGDLSSMEFVEHL